MLKRIQRLPHTGRPEIIKRWGYMILVSDFAFLYVVADGNPLLALAVGLGGGMAGGNLIAGAHKRQHNK